MSSPGRKNEKRERDGPVVDVDAKPQPKVQVQATLNFGGGKATLAAPAKLPDAAPAVPAAPAAAGGALNLPQYLTGDAWPAALRPLFATPSFRRGEAALQKDVAAKAKVFPPLPLVFDALNACPLSKVKLVIVGQDPYPTPGFAHGLCFSVLPGVTVPQSLRNMYAELESDIPGFKRPAHGFLRAWAERGVLMLNATLTVNAGSPNSHKDIGWQDFTDGVIKLVNTQCTGVVFMLWGNFAIKKGKMVDQKKHRVVENAHPSPLSVKKWVGCKAFSRANKALADLGKLPMDWSLPTEADLPPNA